MFLLLIIMLSVSAPFFFFVWRNERKATCHRLTDMAKEIVRNILEQSRWATRQRWINDDEIEFVYLICGSSNEKTKHLVWARVKITQRVISAKIEYAHDLQPETRLFAEIIGEQMRKSKIDATLSQKPSEQPSLDETGVKKYDSGNPTR